MAGDVINSGGLAACNNLKAVAANAKAEKILIVTVAFGDATSARCASGEAYVRDVLAAAASPDDSGNPSVANNNCGDAAKRIIENSDGDYFFCAAKGSELGPIFASAVNAVTKNSILLRIPE